MGEEKDIQKIKRKVTKVDFSGDGSHICICGTPANGQEDVTIMKSKGGNLAENINKAEEVKITTSMATFLEAFFRMWRDDANELAEILGYEAQDWFMDMVGDDTVIELLKDKDPEEVKDIVHDGFTVSKETYDAFKKVRPNFNKLVKSKQDKKEKKENNMADEDLKKELDELKKAQEKQEKELQKAKDSAEAEKAKRQELEKQHVEKEKAEYKELFKGYSFVEGEDVPTLVETALKCKDIEGFHEILKTLEKANTAIANSLEKEKGTDQEKTLDSDAPYVSKVGEIIKERNSK